MKNKKNNLIAFVVCCLLFVVVGSLIFTKEARAECIEDNYSLVNRRDCVPGDWYECSNIPPWATWCYVPGMCTCDMNITGHDPLTGTPPTGGWCAIETIVGVTCYYENEPTTPPPSGNETTPLFSVSISSSLEMIYPGNSKAYTVTVSPVNSYTGIVNLDTASTCPTNATCIFFPTSVNIDATSKTSTLTITTNINIALNTYTISARGTDGS